MFRKVKREIEKGEKERKREFEQEKKKKKPLMDREEKLKGEREREREGGGNKCSKITAIQNVPFRRGKKVGGSVRAKKGVFEVCVSIFENRRRKF